MPEHGNLQHCIEATEAYQKRLAAKQGTLDDGAFRAWVWLYMEMPIDAALGFIRDAKKRGTKGPRRVEALTSALDKVLDAAARHCADPSSPFFHHPSKKSKAPRSTSTARKRRKK
jgi:hypothetical protein